jgi:murein DD-endopeptidase MepM/ murein hydrolase activator NlpD
MTRLRKAQIGTLVVATFAVGGAAGWSIRGLYPETAVERSTDGATPPRRSDEGGDRAAVPRWQISSPGVVGSTGVLGAGRDERGGTDLHTNEAVSLSDNSQSSSQQPSIRSGVPTDLLDRDLTLPIDNADVAALKGHFAQRRGGGSRGHEAVDILAPRHTPVRAADDGTIARLFFSKQGGITVYQFDPFERYCYYYAHLDRYADGLREGGQVKRGDVLGYVGTSGNAPPGTPHLHFAIFQLTPEKRWWTGAPIDPYLVFSR